MLHVAFPKLSSDWFKVLFIQVAKQGFTNERFLAAVNDLISTCEYPEPTFARFLSFDKKIELLDHPGYCEKCNQGLGQFYRLVRKGTSTVQALWAKIEDVEKYGLSIVSTEKREAMKEVEGPIAPKEMAAKVLGEMENLTMKARTRMPRNEFEARRKSAMEALQQQDKNKE